MKKNSNTKRIFCYIAIMFSIIYLGWRAFFTLPFGYGIISIITGVCLLLAEIIGIVSGTEQLIVLDKNYLPIPPDISPDKYPDVDILIATHNEPEELLYKTINGCQNLEYPDKSKVHIFVCDDNERQEIRQLCAKMQVNYLGVMDNKLAKAGNLNYALRHTSSPIIATFDADMIPMSTFLIDTVPYFFIEDINGKRKKIGFVQTPQSFYNADLFQYNLYSEDNVPNEQNFFFREINIVRNKTNTPIYAGSNTLISRRALHDVGGIATGLITEDFATGIRIQKKGYTCYAIDKVEANGLAPNDIKSLIKQRERWARGCIQTLKKEHILFSRKLKFKQKMSYINSLLYWYNPFCRLMYIISPILFGLFGVYALSYTFLEMIYMWLPYFVTYNFAIKFASGNIRNSRLSNVYDTVLFPYLLVPVFLEAVGIKKKKFTVTRKDNSRVGKSSVKYTIPHIIMGVLSIMALMRCIKIAVNTGSPYYIVIIGWLIYNLYSIIMSIFFLTGRKIERSVERFKVETDIEITCNHGKLAGKTIDISDNGLSAAIDFPEYIDDDEIVTIRCKTEKYESEFKASVVYFTEFRNSFKYAFEVKEINDINKRNYLNIIYDREPTLPVIIEEASSVFGEFSSNIHKRFENYTRNSRRLARIAIYKKVSTSDGDKVTLYNFNYEYMLVGMKKEKAKRKINIVVNENVVIKGKAKENKQFILDNGRVAILYKVENLEELLSNKHFRPLLKKCIKEFRIRANEEEKRRKLRKLSNDDELDEIGYVWGGEGIE